MTQLIVNDGLADSQPDTVTITTENSPPVADAGPNQTSDVGDDGDAGRQRLQRCRTAIR